MTNTPVQVGQVVYGVDHHWWLCTEIHADGPYGYHVSGPDSRTPDGGGAGWGDAHHAKHHHGHHHHRRATASPHHADHSTPGSARRTPGVQVQAPSKAIASARPIAGPETPGGSRSRFSKWSDSATHFVNGHPRSFLAAQGVLDVLAGPATVATSLTIALALAPETGGLSLIVEAAFLVYGVTRGGIQTAAGATEIIAAAGGTDEQVKSVSEGAEHAKTLASVSGFILLGTQEVRHHTLSEADWRHAGYLSDAETLITSRRADKAFETATEAVRISRRIARAMQLGGYADKADQVKSYGKDIISGGHWAQEYLAQQELERKKKARPPNPSGSPPPSSAGQK